MSTEIHVTLDGQRIAVRAGTTLAALITARRIAQASLATAVNQSFVPRDARAATVLAEGDTVQCFRPITGG